MAAAPLFGQAPTVKKWSFGLYGSLPDLGGYFIDSGEEPTDLDLKNDFGLKNDKMGLGVRIDYLGPRFGFQLDVGTHSFAGQNRLPKPVKMDGQTFPEGTDITSSLTNTTFDLTGTVKVLRFDHFWLGIDYGLQAWYMQVQAEAKENRDIAPVSYALPLPIPQVGLSLGANALNNMLEFRGRAHFLSYSGATYTLFAADARCYFLPWLGVRAFMEAQRFDAPNSSITDDLEARLDNNRFGFGVALRW